MIENRPWVTIISHATMILGVLLVAFPVWITFVAASHDQVRITQVPLPLLPGNQIHIGFLGLLLQLQEAPVRFGRLLLHRPHGFQPGPGEWHV